jgi:putative membrane protein
MRLIARIITTTLAILLVTKLMPGVSVNNVWTAIVLSIVLSLLNVFVKPLLIFFTLPITIFTLGLFLLVINAAIILIASEIVTGFRVDGFWWAMLFSVVLSLVVSIFDKFNERMERKDE